jgi:hypothetical protein
MGRGRTAKSMKAEEELPGLFPPSTGISDVFKKVSSAQFVFPPV